MKSDLLNLINQISSDATAQGNVNDIVSLYENIQYSHSIDSLIEIIYKWFNTK